MNEKPKINCPHCNTEMDIDNGDLICHKCGVLLSLDWIVKTAFAYVPQNTVALPIYKELFGGDKKLKITLE